MKRITFLLIFLLSQNGYSQKTENRTFQKVEARPLVYGVYGHVFLSGVGLSYEREVGEKISLEIPIEKYYPSGLYKDYEVTGERGFSISPSLRVYPKGITEKSNWSIGPTIRFGKVRYFDYSGYRYNLKKRSNEDSILGIELTNSIFIKVKRIQVGLRTSLGMNYTQGITGTFLNSINIGFVP